MLEWAAAPDPRAFLGDILALPVVDEAIFIASPGLHDAIATWRAKPDSAAGQRAERSLVKYVARAAARATPFGLFSGVTPGALGREANLALGARPDYRRRTRLDNDYLFVLARELASRHREALPLRANTSLYLTAGRLRYAAASVDNKNRSYSLVSAEPTPYLEATLARARGGATRSELAGALVSDDITLAEATAYIDELVDAQLLEPDLGVQITGREPIDGMIAQLRAAQLDAPADVLSSVRAAIAELDAPGAHNPPARYRAIARALEALPAPVELGRLFQVDMVKPGSITLPGRTATELVETIGQLARLLRAPQIGIERFRDAFVARYEDREVSLAEALDEESGIGFERSRAPGAEGSPLLATLAIGAGGAAEGVPWGAAHDHLLRRLATAGAELVLTAEDFTAMAETAPAPAPSAFCALTRLAADGRILFQSATGPSGARMLGRFCHASPEIEAMVAAHHAREEALVPGAMFAEIVHLNEGRIGNLLCRPLMRAHEIEYLGRSGMPREQVLHLADLTVAVRSGRVVLRSRKHGREVIPRMTTAHNFARGLGVYRFLCSLAVQGVQEISWSWGPLQHAPHLPRVRYGRVLVARETWNLDAVELAPITQAVKSGASAAAIAALRVGRGLPRFVALGDGDGELVVDLDNPLLAAAFADELAGRRSARVIEVFPAPGEGGVTGPEGSFANELMLTYVRDDVAAPGEPPRPAATLRRSFVPGGPWLYAKLYTGEATADRVLRDVLAPIVRAHAGPWFFLRYHDPDPHVRVRLHGDPATLWAERLPALESALAPLHATGVVRRLVLDTYDRELERYGGDAGMELVEELFWRDSEAVLGIVELLEGDAGADARWRLAVRGIEALLAALGLDPAAREKVVSDGRELLGRELRADTALWSRIGDRFAKERAALDVLFTPSAADAEHDLEPGLALLAARDVHVRDIAERMRARDVPIADLAWSLVHMHANRLLHASQRAQELVLYDFLRRLHVSRRSRRG